MAGKRTGKVLNLLYLVGIEDEALEIKNLWKIDLEGASIKGYLLVLYLGLVFSIEISGWLQVHLDLRG